MRGTQSSPWTFLRKRSKRFATEIVAEETAQVPENRHGRRRIKGEDGEEEKEDDILTFVEPELTDGRRILVSRKGEAMLFVQEGREEIGQRMKESLGGGFTIHTRSG